MKWTFFILAFVLSACSNTGFTGSGAAGTATKKKDKSSSKDDPSNDDPQKQTDGADGADGADGKTTGGADGDDSNADTDGTSGDQGDHANKDPGLGEDDETKYADLPVSLNYQAFQGEAADTNCISVQLNKGAPVEMGCNFGPNQFSAKTLTAKAKPFCNVLRIINQNTTAGATITTKNAAQIRWGVDQVIDHFLGMKIFEIAAGSIEGHINDNGDDVADIDVRFQITGLTDVNYTVENSGHGCESKVTIP